MRQRSVPRTVVSGSSFSHTGPELWPTPTVCGNNNRPYPGKACGTGLATAARMLPTPTATDSPTRSNRSKSPGAAVRPGLEMMAARGLWPTPMASDAKAGSKAGSLRKSPQLRDIWPTPCARDDHGPRAGHTKGGTDLPSEVVKRTLWATPKAMDAEQPGRTPGKEDARQPLTVQAGGGRLNPTWVEWLMGLPLGWTHVEDGPASVALGMAPSSSKSRSRL